MTLIAVRPPGTPPKTKEMRDVEQAWERDGLAVTRSASPDTGWTITHVGSGYALMAGLSKKRAIESARAFLIFGDWTRSRTACTKDKAFVAAVRSLRAKLWEDLT